MPFTLERTEDSQFNNLDVIETPYWKLYDLDDECDLLVVESLKDPLLNRACSLLSLSWISHLRPVIPTALFADDITKRVSTNYPGIRDRAWLQEKTDVIPLNFIVYRGSSSNNFSVMSFLHGECCDVDLAESTLGKFLFKELRTFCFQGFSKMIQLVPQLKTTQFNFGFDKDNNLKLIGCPGHLVNSVYDECFISNFLDFWFNP